MTKLLAEKLLLHCVKIILGTKVQVQYTFSQSKLKKEFVIMNQVSRQKAKTEL